MGTYQNALLATLIVALMVGCDKSPTGGANGGGGASSGGAANVDPTPKAPTVSEILVGRWCRQPQPPTKDYEILSFDGNGHLDASQTTENPLMNVYSNAMGKIHCSYSVDGNTLTTEVIGADNQVSSLARTGEISHITVTVESPNSIRLSESIIYVAPDPVKRFTRLR